jgi:hypothetical protein
VSPLVILWIIPILSWNDKHSLWNHRWWWIKDSF